MTILVLSLVFAQVERVVIVSVDGLRPEFYLSDAWEMATLRAWSRQGAHAKAVESVFPSVTYAAHASILTGVRPGRHGIVANGPFGESGPAPEWYWEAKDIGARTLWQAAKEKGLATAIVFWPSSVGADVQWRLPERWAVRDGEKTAELLPRLATKGLAAELALAVGVPKEMDGREGKDAFIAECAAYVLRKYKPRLMFVHLGEVDYYSHRDGPNSESARKAVARTDAQLVKVWRAAEMLESAALIVTGDHGFAEARESVAPNVVLAQAGMIELEGGRVKRWKAMAHAHGGSATVYVKDDVSVAEVIAVLEKAAVEGVRRRYRVLDRKRLDELGANLRAAFALEAEAGFAFSGAVQGSVVERWTSARGYHGYLPERANMATGFVAIGAGIKVGGCVERMRLIDIAPTVARLLALAMDDVEGRVVAEILE
ncbi:MAG: alkaline phosphatase family protein [Planctomycetes bacterium]|nr:alkaline phosphatase family protein [Planctomycetota bacterium]